MSQIMFRHIVRPPFVSSALTTFGGCTFGLSSITFKLNFYDSSHINYIYFCSLFVCFLHICIHANEKFGFSKPVRSTIRKIREVIVYDLATRSFCFIPKYPYFF